MSCEICNVTPEAIIEALQRLINQGGITIRLDDATSAPYDVEAGVPIPFLLTLYPGNYSVPCRHDITWLGLPVTITDVGYFYDITYPCNDKVPLSTHYLMSHLLPPSYTTYAHTYLRLDGKFALDNGCVVEFNAYPLFADDWRPDIPPLSEISHVFAAREVTIYCDDETCETIPLELPHIANYTAFHCDCAEMLDTVCTDPCQFCLSHETLHTYDEVGEEGSNNGWYLLDGDPHTPTTGDTLLVLIHINTCEGVITGYKYYPDEADIEDIIAEGIFPDTYLIPQGDPAHMWRKDSCLIQPLSECGWGYSMGYSPDSSMGGTLGEAFPYSFRACPIILGNDSACCSLVNADDCPPTPPNFTWYTLLDCDEIANVCDVCESSTYFFDTTSYFNVELAE